MRAAGLHPIETILTSQAVLIRSNKPKPSADASHSALIDRISQRIAGVVAAGKFVLCNYNIRRDMVPEATKVTPGRRAPTVSPLDDPEWVAVSSMVLKAQVADVMDRLQVHLALPLSCCPSPFDVRPLVRADSSPAHGPLSLSRPPAGDRRKRHPRHRAAKLPRLSGCGGLFERGRRAIDWRREGNGRNLRALGLYKLSTMLVSHRGTERERRRKGHCCIARRGEVCTTRRGRASGERGGTTRRVGSKSRGRGRRERGAWRV